jgi:hypothetical protein
MVEALAELQRGRDFYAERKWADAHDGASSSPTWSPTTVCVSCIAPN